VKSYGSVDGVSTPQAMLGRQILSLLGQILVQGQQSYIGQASHGRGELSGSSGIAASPADGRGYLYTEQIGNDDGQRLCLQKLKELPAALVPGLAPIECIDPNAGVNSVHPSTPHREHRSRQRWRFRRILGRKRVPDS
jgi:hypothetical protein